MTEDILAEINRKKSSNPNSIIACRYGHEYGAPCYFPSSYFDTLGKCEGKNGAKSVLRKNLDLVAFVDFPGGEIDIDREEDLVLLD